MTVLSAPSTVEEAEQIRDDLLHQCVAAEWNLIETVSPPDSYTSNSKSRARFKTNMCKPDYVKLTYVKLTCVKLTCVKLTYVKLTCVKLTCVKLTCVKLTYVKLTCIELIT